MSLEKWVEYGWLRREPTSTGEIKDLLGIVLEVAKDVFNRDGAAASLDEIARRSGNGNATLYRHFPTRDDLIEAVYRSEVEKLAAAEQRFATTMPPLEALRAWMLLFIDHVAAKRLIIPAMDTVAGGAARS
jgi:AcrR family transcriptional regulator